MLSHLRAPKHSTFEFAFGWSQSSNSQLGCSPRCRSMNSPSRRRSFQLCAVDAESSAVRTKRARRRRPSEVRQLGWPSPRHFLEIGAALGNSFEEQRHAHACKLRLKNHFAFIELDQEIQENGYQRPTTGLFKFLVNFMPMNYRKVDFHLEVPNKGDSVSQTLNRLLAWFFAEFTVGLMESGFETWEQLLPASVEYQRIFANHSRQKFSFELHSKKRASPRPSSFQRCFSVCCGN